jgi:hypothetical protein
MVDRGEVRAALQMIQDNADSKALNWAVDYATEGLKLLNKNCTNEDLKRQLLYVAGNINHWRGDQAKLVRSILKENIKSL